MNLFTAAFSKIFKSGNQQVLDKIKPLIVEINNREKALSSLKGSRIQGKNTFFKKTSFRWSKIGKTNSREFFIS